MNEWGGGLEKIFCFARLLGLRTVRTNAAVYLRQGIHGVAS